MESKSLASYVSGMPDILLAPVTISPYSPIENQILTIVHARWPTSSLEVAEYLGHSIRTREDKRLFSSRITYHIKKLVHKKRLMSKRVGHALIVWPLEVEALRVMQGMLNPRDREPG
ncbi:MAG: hypothetical protein Q8P05_02530 [Candidatus Diapherotrites archaeon]|nr:hypothetical protein [Candidatus Diapherotrites archaeon]MDZ4256895.1 hypothetical protein [archaeon]